MSAFIMPKNRKELLLAPYQIKAVCAYNNGVITALGVGMATITLEYRGGDVLSDKYNSAIINVTVTEYVAPTETYIKVTPVYNADGYYNQNDGNSTKYTASLVNGTGIIKKWDITCSSDELTEALIIAL